MSQLRHLLKLSFLVVKRFPEPLSPVPRLRDALEAECLLVERRRLFLVGYRDRDMPELSLHHVLPPFLPSGRWKDQQSGPRPISLCARSLFRLLAASGLGSQADWGQDS